jgi:hypothetical protein
MVEERILNGRGDKRGKKTNMEKDLSFAIKCEND